MKQILLFIAVLCAVTLSTSSAPSITSAKNASKERAVVKFDQPIILLGETLKGEYLFVHDIDAMAQGDACTSVYKGLAEVRENFVFSFHCRPRERSKVAHFTVRSVLSPKGENELTEFQFAGSSEAHLVPIRID